MKSPLTLELVAGALAFLAQRSSQIVELADSMHTANDVEATRKARMYMYMAGQALDQADRALAATMEPENDVDRTFLQHFARASAEGAEQLRERLKECGTAQTGE